jgi:uncharacterized protein
VWIVGCRDNDWRHCYADLDQPYLHAGSTINPPEMSHSIFSFLKEEKLLTICTSAGNIPHAAICYYVFDEQNMSLIFSSENKTTHIRNALINPNVSGTILSQKTRTGFAKGLQFSGTLAHHLESNNTNARSLYYKKFPIALTMKGDIWVIRLSKIKMTDNRAGYTRKLQWQEQLTET